MAASSPAARPASKSPPVPPAHDLFGGLVVGPVADDFAKEGRKIADAGYIEAAPPPEGLFLVPEEPGADTHRHEVYWEIDTDGPRCMCRDFLAHRGCKHVQAVTAFIGDETDRDEGVLVEPDSVPKYRGKDRHWYAKRSAVESAFSSLKVNFEGRTQAMTDLSIRNEVVCKVLCYNILLLINGILEDRMWPDFMPGSRPVPKKLPKPKWGPVINE